MKNCPFDDEHPTVYPVDETQPFRYHYRTAGRYQLVVTAGDGCPGDADVFFGGQVRLATLTIDVTHSSTHSNGVERPEVQARNAPTVKDSRITLFADIHDPDGFVRTSAVDWGNGAPPTVTQYPNAKEPQPCRDHDGRTWPEEGTAPTIYQTSPQMAPGTYQVKVTVTSSGCDGKDEQTASRTWTVRVS